MNNPWIYVVAGFMIGFFLAVEIFRSNFFAKKRKEEYYDEFVYQLSRLPEKDLEKVLQSLRDAWKCMQKK